MGEILKQQNRLLVDFGNPLVKLFLPILLQDHTTGKNIIWATEPPENLTGMYSADDEITIEKIFEVDIKPRCLKRITDQKKRTHNKAEVFTPTWLCNKMNNNIDNEWFKKENVLIQRQINHGLLTKRRFVLLKRVVLGKIM